MPTRSTMPPTECARYVRNNATGYFLKDAFSAPQDSAAALPDTLRLETVFSKKIAPNATRVLTIIPNPLKHMPIGQAPVFTGLKSILRAHPLLFYGNRVHALNTENVKSDIICLFSDDGQVLVMIQLTGTHHARITRQRAAALPLFPEMKALLTRVSDTPNRRIAPDANLLF